MQGCSDIYPICIKYDPGLQFEADLTWLGISAYLYVAILLPPAVTIPDFQIAFKLQVPDLVTKFMVFVEEPCPRVRVRVSPRVTLPHNTFTTS